MQNHKLICIFLIFLSSLAVFSCAATHAPSRWLREAEQLQYDPYGGWIGVKTPANKMFGELIAVTEDSVFIADSVFHAVPAKMIISARLASYQSSGLEAFPLIGALSTISNGWYLIFTFPMWSIGGTIAVVYRSYEPILDYPQKDLLQFRQFSRYPQGLPDNADRTKIRMRIALDQ